jgi:hypothetical protein
MNTKKWHIEDVGGIVNEEGTGIASVRLIGKEEVNENATLIAAAPELLALLIEVVSELSDTDEEGLIEHTEWMMKARATIAKAKGE